MNLPELKGSIKSLSVDELKLIIVEMYRIIPKKHREEKHIDDLIRDPGTYMQFGKTLTKQSTKIDFPQLKQEIEIFIENAQMSYYFAPNNVVHKTQRPKWRFKVRQYLKDLQQIPMDTPDGLIATDLLDQLFGVLSQACHRYLFNTTDPFRSIGTPQTDMFEIIITRRIHSGQLVESIKKAVSTAVNSYTESFTPPDALINLLTGKLETADSKLIALKQCDDLRKNLVTTNINNSRKNGRSFLSEYYGNQQYNNLIELAFDLNVLLGDIPSGIKYFKDYYREKDHGRRISKLLKLLESHGLNDYRQKEYEAAITKGLKPEDLEDQDIRIIYFK